jgi:hypothetical protein
MKGRSMRLIQKAALVFGGAYLAVGVIGFVVTGFTGWIEATGDQLLTFAINPFHNLIHIVIGGLWLLAARLPQRGAAAGVFLGIGSIYTGAAVLGFLGALPILGISETLAPVNFLHIVTGVAAIAISVVFGEWSRQVPETAASHAVAATGARR